MKHTGRWRSPGGRSTYAAAYTDAMALLPTPDATRDLSTSFGIVRCYDWARKSTSEPPVLLLPGRASGVPMWADTLADIVGTRRVLAFDALGDAGMSEQTRPFRSFADQATWVDDGLAAAGVAAAHVVGHSFGGATATTLALRRPQRVASLALLEPVFTLSWPPVSTFAWTTLLALPAPQAWRDEAMAHIGGTTVAQVRERSPLSRMIDAGAKFYRAALPTPRPLSDTQLRQLDMPTFVAIAARSSLAGGQQALQRAQLIPHVQAATWPGTTHSLPMQAHATLDPALIDFWLDVDHPQEK